VADPRVHLNLIDSSAQLFALDPAAEVETGEGWLFGAGGHAHPMIANAAFRGDDDLNAEELLARAGEFFGERGRGFSVWIRGGQPEDRDLLAAAEDAGLRLTYEMPEMVLRSPVEEPPLPAAAELHRLTSAEEAEDYWRIAASAYASVGFPPDLFAGYSDYAGLLAPDLAAFIVHFEGEPVSIAMTIVNHGIAGVYWVGSLERARGKGLGRAATAAATNAGFGLGAELASLQASPMGKPIYLQMGFEEVFEYKLLTSPGPLTGQSARRDSL
jgi:GNAT superfamily N-acetyltransferase